MSKKLLKQIFATIFAFSVCATIGVSASGAPDVMSSDAYTQTTIYNDEINLLGDMAFTATIASKEAFDALSVAERKPSGVLLNIKENDFVAENGDVIDSVGNVVRTLSQAGILLTVKVASQEDVEAITQNKTYFNDCSVLSGDASLLKQLKEAVPYVRVYTDFSQKEAYTDAYDYIKESREAGGSLVVLSPAQADEDTVYYLQAMLTTVWIVPEADGEIDYADAIGRGACGMIASDYAAFHELMLSYSENSMARPFYNIAHRGLPMTYNENSIEGCLAAYNGGATHIEVDIHKTLDDQLVIMHDANIIRTTNGKGLIKDMTLEQIKQYKITRTMQGATTETPSEIPTLNELFEATKDTDLFYVLEIKDNDEKTCGLIDEVVKEFNRQNRCVAISFYDNQVERAHSVMPYMPVAFLTTPSNGTIDAMLDKASRWNASFDASYTSLSRPHSFSLLKRGYMRWLWTYNDEQGVQDGVTGNTNNYANVYRYYVKSIRADRSFTVKADARLEEEIFYVSLKSYGGTECEVAATVFQYEETNEGYRAILQYTDTDNNPQYTYYTRAVEIVREEKKEEPTQPSKGCNSTLTTVSVGAVGLTVVAIAVSILAVKKKKSL